MWPYDVKLDFLKSWFHIRSSGEIYLLTENVLFKIFFWLFLSRFIIKQRIVSNLTDATQNVEGNNGKFIGH